MPSARTVLERLGDRVSVPQPAFDRLVRRRRQQQRNRRVAAGALGLTITAALVIALANASSRPQRQPAVTPSVPRSNGAIAYTLPEDGGDGGIYLAREGSPPQRIVGSAGDGIDELCPAFSPDGTRLAYRVVEWPRTVRLVVADLGEVGIVPGTTRAITSYTLEEPNQPPCATWSPDGRHLLYDPVDGDEAIRIVPVSDGDDRVLDGLGAHLSDWSPDLSKLVFVSAERVWVVGVGDDELIAEFAVETKGAVAWAPDSTRFVVGTQLLDVEAGTIRELDAGAGVLGLPRWSPDGSMIAYGRAIVRVDDSSWFEVPLPALPRSEEGDGPPIWSVGWSPDGTQLVTARGCSIFTVPIDGSSAPVLISSEETNPWSCTRPPHIDWQGWPR